MENQDENITMDSRPVMVTIRCITYNHEPYIRECLEGFVMQKTNFRFVAIVHDDASTDGTAAIIREYEKKYPDIIKPIYETENQFSKRDGSFTRLMNNACDATGCKYVACCEGDDYWIDPLKLQKQVDLLEKNKDCTYCFTFRYIQNDITGKRSIGRYRRLKYIQEDFLAGFNPGIQSAMMRRIDLDKIGLNPYLSKINGDRLFPYIGTKGGSAICLPDITAVYRVTGKGISTSLSEKESEKDWFVHATNDFYSFHENLKFPSSRAYIKGCSQYLVGFMRNFKSFDLKLSYNQVARYNKKNRMWLFIQILFCSIQCICIKLLNKCFL